MTTARAAGGWRLSPLDASAYEQIAAAEAGFHALFDAVLAVAQQVVIAEIHAAEYSDACRRGTRIAQHDLLALLAARSCSNLVDVERKVIATGLLGDSCSTPLDAAFRAALRHDAARLMPHFSPADIDAWLADSKRWRSRS